RVSVRHAVLERLGPVSRRDAGGVEQVLHAVRNSVEWTTISPHRDLAVRLFGLRERRVAREGDDASQLAVIALDAIEVDLREACGGELARLDPARESRDRSECDVGVV